VTNADFDQDAGGDGALLAILLSLNSTSVGIAFLASGPIFPKAEMA